jgi:hypothetical protein
MITVEASLSYSSMQLRVLNIRHDAPLFQSRENGSYGSVAPLKFPQVEVALKFIEFPNFEPSLKFLSEFFKNTVSFEYDQPSHALY